MKENRQKEKESGIGLPIISKAQRVQLQKKRTATHERLKQS